MSFTSYLARLNNRRACPRIIKFSRFQKIFILLTFFTGVFFTLRIVNAQSTNLIEQKQDAINAGGNQEAWLNEALGSNAVAGLRGLIGEIPKDVLEGKVNLKKTGYIPGGVMGITTNLIASLYAPAGGTSGVQYIAQSFRSFLGQPAYAQGVGFAGLQPIQSIWRGFRNVTYLLSSIIFIIVGIMIMLRVKISPQATITIQNAVPQIITTLILITFSYAIAGLLIDAMQFIQSTALAVLFNMQDKKFGTSLFDFSLHDYTFAGLSNADMNTVAGLTQRAIPMAPFIVWGIVLGGIIGAFTGPQNALIGAGLAIPILLLVLAILMLIWMFKFYFGCLKCYVTAIFKIIIAPLEIAAGAFPNSKMGFNTWVWDLIANLAVFPISIIFLVLGNIIIDAVSWTGTTIWVPSIIGGASLQSAVVGGISLTNVISVGIGLSIVALMSKLPEMIPQFIFMIKPSPWQAAIGEGLDMSKNPAYRAARGVGYGLASEEVRNAGTGSERLPRLGNVISKVSSRINPGAPDQAQNALADYLKQQAK